MSTVAQLKTTDFIDFTAAQPCERRRKGQIVDLVTAALMEATALQRWLDRPIPDLEEARVISARLRMKFNQIAALAPADLAGATRSVLLNATRD